MPGNIGKQAVVVGAGMGGLTAARALADYFESVVVLERDSLPSTAAHRVGTPQAPHVHVLLTSGYNALTRLYPNFDDDLRRAGAVQLRAGLDVRNERPGYDPFPQRDLGWSVYSMSRALLEHTVRTQLAKYPNVVVRQRCRAEKVLMTSDGAAASGVAYESSDGRRDVVPADMVVDSSGRGNLTLELLKSSNRHLPEETVIGVDFRYATAMIPIPNDAPTGWMGVYTLPEAPASSCGGLMMPVEGRKWVLSLAANHGAQPPDSWNGFLEFTRKLRTLTIYNAISASMPIDRIVEFGFPESVRRHFESLENFPKRFLPLGDAICRFNPVYGQGMSVAALEAGMLHSLLGARGSPEETLDRLSTRYFEEASSLIDAPWAIAAGMDLVYPQTRGKRPPDFEMMTRFGLALNRIAARDPEVHKLTVEVQHLLKPRSALLAPKIVERVRSEMSGGS